MSDMPDMSDFPAIDFEFPEFPEFGTVTGLRLSKTSIKPWILHGPIHLALKTSIQANAVRFHPLKMELHGQSVELEMWVNADEDAFEKESPNTTASMVLLVQRTGKSIEQMMDEQSHTEGGGFVMSRITWDQAKMVPGPAIITGMGLADLPEIPNTTPLCFLHALMGNHDEHPNEDPNEDEH